MKWIIKSAAVAGLLSGVVVAESPRPYFNDLRVPEGRDDVLAIQKWLQKNLKAARAATICIELKEGSGSGVIISADGLALSAAHVTTAVGEKLKVKLEDGRELKATSLGVNSENDAAMLQIESADPLPFIPIEPASAQQKQSTRVGDWVFALGHSGGFDKERGIVVRLGRMVRVTGQTVRTDCLLIGGDSGGPLFDINGVLIGIHSRVGGRASQNMHVPMQAFHQSWDQLKASEFIGNGPFAKRKQAAEKAAQDE